MVFSHADRQSKVLGPGRCPLSVDSIILQGLTGVQYDCMFSALILFDIDDGERLT